MSRKYPRALQTGLRKVKTVRDAAWWTREDRNMYVKVGLPVGHRWNKLFAFCHGRQKCFIHLTKSACSVPRDKNRSPSGIKWSAPYTALEAGSTPTNFLLEWKKGEQEKKEKKVLRRRRRRRRQAKEENKQRKLPSTSTRTWDGRIKKRPTHNTCTHMRPLTRPLPALGVKPTQCWA